MCDEHNCICKYCNKKLSRRCYLREHERSCKLNPEYIPKKLICRFCSKSFIRACGLKIHEDSCKQNPNRIHRKTVCNLPKERMRPPKEGGWKCPYCEETLRTRRDLDIHKHKCHPLECVPVWNKGKTKDTDERIRIRTEKIKELYRSGKLKPTYKGKHHSEETKKKISGIRKAYLRQHPGKVPYLLNHHRKGPSYPERYFKFILDINKIKFEMDYPCIGYFLDFAFPRVKVYFEVDGDQHYLDRRIVEHDIERTRNLEENGWKCIRRIRWSHFRNLSYEQRKYYISDMIEEIRKALNSES